MIFSLTGGIASGKSTVSRTLVKHGVKVIDADIIARQVVEPGSYGLHTIVELFGASMLLPDGTLDRAKMGALVFEYPCPQVRQECIATLNELMLPLIRMESARQLQKLQAEGHALICYEAPLLVETGNADKYRPLIVVSCPPEIQVERMIKRDGLTREQAMGRLGAQMPNEQKVAMADYVVDSSGTIEDSVKQTEVIIDALKKSFRCYACYLDEVMDVLVLEPKHTCNR